MLLNICSLILWAVSKGTCGLFERLWLNSRLPIAMWKPSWSASVCSSPCNRRISFTLANWAIYRKAWVAACKLYKCRQTTTLVRSNEIRCRHFLMGTTKKKTKQKNGTFETRENRPIDSGLQQIAYWYQRTIFPVASFSFPCGVEILWCTTASVHLPMSERNAKKYPRLPIAFEKFSINKLCRRVMQINMLCTKRNALLLFFSVSSSFTHFDTNSCWLDASVDFESRKIHSLRKAGAHAHEPRENPNRYEWNLHFVCVDGIQWNERTIWNIEKNNKKKCF